MTTENRRKNNKGVGLSRLEKYISFFCKNKNKKFTVKEVYDHFSFHTTMEYTRICLEKGVVSEKIKSTITEAGVTYHL